jgi:hypothetical protein
MGVELFSALLLIWIPIYKTSIIRNIKQKVIDYSNFVSHSVFWKLRVCNLLRLSNTRLPVSYSSSTSISPFPLSTITPVKPEVLKTVEMY